MPIPDFQAIMRPFLELAAEHDDVTLQGAIRAIGERFSLTPDERAELLPSGFQAKFTNRVAWAATHLQKAGALERVGRGRYAITLRGRELIKSPEPITTIALNQFAEYRAFKTGQPREAVGVHGEAPASVTDTPEEIIESVALGLRQQLAADLLERIKAAPPDFFERVVVDLLVAMGYGGSRSDAGRAVGRSGDEGIDGVIKEDRLGLDAIYVQAKRWEKSVGRPEIQQFSGGLDGQKATKGVFLTTSTFTAEARRFVREIGKRIVLIDGLELAGLMIDNGVGVTTVATYAVRAVDLDYFESA